MATNRIMTAGQVRAYVSGQRVTTVEQSVHSFVRYSLVSFVWVLLLSPCAVGTSQSSAEPRQRYVPPEMLVANSELKSLLDAANHSADLGNYEECFATLQRALDFSTRQNSLGDKAIVEDHLAVAYFTQGQINDAKSQWLSSLSDGIAISNLVLQADVLVALSALSQQEGDLNQSLRLANQALDLARKSKNLYIQSRALGELGHMQLLRPRDRPGHLRFRGAFLVRAEAGAARSVVRAVLPPNPLSFFSIASRRSMTRRSI